MSAHDTVDVFQLDEHRSKGLPSYLRRLVAMQAVISFLFNAMVLALSINLAANLIWVRVCAAGAMQHR